MKITSNIVYIVLISTLLVFNFIFVLVAVTNSHVSGGVFTDDRFNVEKTAEDIAEEQGEREKFKLRCRAVTADDYASLEGYDNISVELVVDNVYLDFVSDYSYRTEYYELIGRDSTDALWLVSITREHKDEPVPTEAYPVGTNITVYGYLRGDEYLAMHAVRAPEISGEYIDIQPEPKSDSKPKPPPPPKP